ncbi:MAG: Asp-tRNA(Asn)/Glu-tRNA(Gln) amidotransferase subunit GatC [Phycisphaerae bacterium]
MSHQIDAEQIRHIGLLSRIELTDEQVESFGRQLTHILSAFDKIQQIDTDDVEPLVHPVELHNVLAEDKLGPSLTVEQALANAPQRDGDYFKVPKVIGESQ